MGNSVQHPIQWPSSGDGKPNEETSRWTEFCGGSSTAMFLGSLPFPVDGVHGRGTFLPRHCSWSSTDSLEDGRRRLEVCLVGKFISPKSASREGLENSMKMFACEWGSLIRNVEDVSVANGVMKVRVRINITRPLKRGLRVAIDEKGTNVSLPFQYEHLLEFCYDCGIIGHKALDFPLKDFQDDKIGPIQSGRYGSWMCAPSSLPRVQRQWGGSKQTEIGGESHFMNMKEVGKIVEAVKSSWRRRNLVEEVAAISGLESQAREEEICITLGDEAINGEILSIQTMRHGDPSVPPAQLNTEEECPPFILSVFPLKDV
ncbi:hypothetical protein F8388_015465 [Cannabis sativa]|uniref:Zinc knuckle CX2CX4HX4C domain-containing protein n=1 Tax=Cannabis sativa TaxID=3483 RepID=A0A7J6GID2_CANSA|nr:hypothetical protein F8388_015465 [Cannabis sativa]